MVLRLFPALPFVLLVLGCVGHPPAEGTPVPPSPGMLGGPRADFGGVTTPSSPVGQTLSRLVEDGGGLDFSITFDTSPPPSGGLAHRGASRALIDLGYTLDLETAVGLEGATAFVEVYAQEGRHGSESTGDIQGYSNIDEDDVLQLAELWVEQSLLDEALRIKVGKVDANREFAFVEAGLEFLSSSAGFSPTIHVFPTYPDPAVGLNVFVRPAGGAYAGLGIYNAVEGGAISGRRGMSAHFDELFLIGEAGFEWGSDASVREGRLAAGGWEHSGELEEFDGGLSRGTGGLYVIAEQEVLREDLSTAEGLSVFLQLGLADGEVSEIERHSAIGALYTGLCPGRGDDATGLYVTWAGLTDEEGAGVSGHELAIELFHAFRVRPWLTIKPDVQLIVNPSGRSDIHDALVGTLRVEFM